jgi:hypothetical protein
MQTQYYRNTNTEKSVQLRRVFDGNTQYFSPATNTWTPSKLSAADLAAKASYKRVNRDEARRGFNRAF